MVWPVNRGRSNERAVVHCGKMEPTSSNRIDVIHPQHVQRDLFPTRTSPKHSIEINRRELGNHPTPTISNNRSDAISRNHVQLLWAINPQLFQSLRSLRHSRRRNRQQSTNLDNTTAPPKAVASPWDNQPQLNPFYSHCTTPCRTVVEKHPTPKRLPLHNPHHGASKCTFRTKDSESRKSLDSESKKFMDITLLAVVAGEMGPS